MQPHGASSSTAEPADPSRTLFGPQSVPMSTAHDDSGTRIRQASYDSYGATSSTSSGSPRLGESGQLRPGKGKQPAQDDGGDFSNGSEVEMPVIDVTWRYLSRLYLLVPIITFVWLAILLLIVSFAWPPDQRERDAGQEYPHRILWKPFAIGFFTSCTVQVGRIPIWEMVSFLPLSSRLITVMSTSIHTILHELLRLASTTLIIPSPISGFHSSYYLGLGWGVAEAAWGIVQGWEQLTLYEDAMRPEEGQVEEWTEENDLGIRKEDLSSQAEEDDEGWVGGLQVAADIQETDEMDEAELERKVEILERMRGRRDLEEVIGVPFPNIPFPLHLLWRLDTLLLNLGLTLILTAFYFDPYPIYRHFGTTWTSTTPPLDALAGPPAREPSRYLWLVWALVTVLHVGVSLVWKIVGRLGVGAVTWGGLIVALGSVFAGLGAWGGLV